MKDPCNVFSQREECTIARTLKVKVSLGTPLRESPGDRPLRPDEVWVRFFRDRPRKRSETRRGGKSRNNRRDSTRTHVPRRLRDTALKVVAGSRDPRENRTVSHVPGGAIGNRFRRSHLRSLRSSVRLVSTQQRSLDRYYRTESFLRQVRVKTIKKTL